MNSITEKEIRRLVTSINIGDQNKFDMPIQAAIYLRKEHQDATKTGSGSDWDDYLDVKKVLESLFGNDYNPAILDMVEGKEKLGSIIEFYQYLESIYYLTYRDDPEYRPELLKYTEEEILNYIKQADPKEIECYNQQNPENKII